jgi:hypothetical protein
METVILSIQADVANFSWQIDGGIWKLAGYLSTDHNMMI